jgi:TPR repeat protein
MKSTTSFKSSVVLELGTDLSEAFNSKRYKKLISNVYAFLSEKYKLNLSSVSTTENSELDKWECRVSVYGNKIYRFDFSNQLAIETPQIKKNLESLETAIRRNLDLLIEKGVMNINALKKESSKESYRIFYIYYSERGDRKKAFHWLKKLSSFNDRRYLTRLALAYKDGKGCKQDPVQAQKIFHKINTLENNNDTWEPF